MSDEAVKEGVTIESVEDTETLIQAALEEGNTILTFSEEVWGIKLSLLGGYEHLDDAFYLAYGVAKAVGSPEARKQLIDVGKEHFALDATTEGSA